MHVVGIYDMQVSCMQLVHASSCKNHVTCMVHTQHLIRIFVLSLISANLWFGGVTVGLSSLMHCTCETHLLPISHSNANEMDNVMNLMQCVSGPSYSKREV